MNKKCDPFGQRVKKTSGTVVSYFVYDESGHVLGEYDNNGLRIREYAWLGERVVAMRSSQLPNVLLQVHTDHLGTPRAVSNGATVLWRWEGDQFGDVLPNEDADGNSVKFTMPLRHAGQYFDSEVGLFYNYFRDYNPKTGRYVQSDPIGLKGGMNTYGYVGGNALGAVDPDGLMAAIPYLANAARIGSGLSKSQGLTNAAANSVGASAAALGMAGYAPRPAPHSHSDEDFALNTPPWSDCPTLLMAIQILDAQIAWRKSDLNPRERGTRVYVNHQTRIRILQELRNRLQQEYNRRCKNQCTSA